MIKKAVLFLTILSSLSFAQFLFDSTDVEICNSKFNLAVEKDLTEKPIGDVIVEIGKSFLQTPYEAFTLEKGDKENVVVHLTGLDCYTFFESSLALARAVKKGNTGFNSYLKEIEKLRYRGGKLNGYASRLHYAIDWLYDNQKRGIVKDISKDLGGVVLNKKVGFMTAHPGSYKRMKDKPEIIKQIKSIENEINSRTHYFIPQDEIEKIENKIHNGDLVFCTTKWDGLIVGHTGIAVKSDDGRIHFMHAPLAGSVVQISEQPLSDYIKAVEKHTGVIIIRPLEPVKN